MATWDQLKQQIASTIPHLVLNQPKSHVSRPTVEQAQEKFVSDSIHVPSVREPNQTSHIHHVEDHMFTHGHQGGLSALNYIHQISRGLSGKSSNVKVSLKMDGSPSLVVGRHPQTGLLFVSPHSSFLGKSPKISYTMDDIEKNHPDARGKDLSGLRAKLAHVLKHGRNLDIKGIHVGDLLYTPESKRWEKINGKDHLVFKPNQITYASPLSGPHSKDIMNSDVGMAFHTMLEPTKSGWKKTTDHNIHDYIKPNKSFWFTGTQIHNTPDGSAYMSEGDHKHVGKLLTKANEHINNAKPLLNHLTENKPLSDLFMRYINHAVKTNSEPNREGFDEFMTKSIGTEAGNDPSAIKEKNKFIKDNRQHLDSIFKGHQFMTQAKLHLLDQSKTNLGLGTYFRDQSGVLRPTTHEGLVATNTKEGNSLKLVNRREFSKRNFDNPRGFEQTF
jgi:hypothetical protein